MTQDVFTPDQSAPEVPVTDKRLQDKDQFIEQLKTEMAELRKDLGTRVNAETQLDELRREIQALRSQGTQPKEQTTPSLTVSDIKTLVAQTITATEEGRTASDNIVEANTQMVRHFGTKEKAAEAVQKKADEMKVSVSFLKDVAAKSPSAFASIMEVTVTQEQASTFTTGTVRSESHLSPAPQEGTKAFFDSLRKTNPKEYWRPATQQRIMDAAIKGTYIP